MKLFNQKSEDAVALLRAFGVKTDAVKKFKFEMDASNDTVEFPTVTIEYYLESDSMDIGKLVSVTKKYNLVEKE